VVLRGRAPDKASIKWAEASVGGETANIEWMASTGLHKASGANLAGKDGRAGRKGAGWGCIAVVDADLVAAEA
jgi:hypothetical protein